MTVTAGSSALTQWTVTWAVNSGERISQLWNGTLTLSSSTAVVRNLAWNGSLAPGGSTQFGLLGSGTPSTPVLSCTAS